MIRIYPAEIYTLRSIPKNGINNRQLSAKLSVHDTTIGKRLNSMELKGLISIDRSHGGNCVKITKLGRSLL